MNCRRGQITHRLRPRPRPRLLPPPRLRPLRRLPPHHHLRHLPLLLPRLPPPPHLGLPPQPGLPLPPPRVWLSSRPPRGLPLLLAFHSSWRFGLWTVELSCRSESSNIS